MLINFGKKRRHTQTHTHAYIQTHQFKTFMWTFFLLLIFLSCLFLIQSFGVFFYFVRIAIHIEFIWNSWNCYVTAATAAAAVVSCRLHLGSLTLLLTMNFHSLDCYTHSGYQMNNTYTKKNSFHTHKHYTLANTYIESPPWSSLSSYISSTHVQNLWGFWNYTYFMVPGLRVDSFISNCTQTQSILSNKTRRKGRQQH